MSAAEDVRDSIPPDIRLQIATISAGRMFDITAALIALRNAGQRAAPYVTPLLQHPDWQVRDTAVFLLGTSKDPGVVDPLLAALDDIDSSVASTAAASLARFGDPRILPVLLGIFRDANRSKHLRAGIAWTLGRIGDPQAIEALKALVESRNGPSSIREVAVRVLGLSDHREAENTIASVLQDEGDNRDVRINAAGALADLLGRDAATSLERVATNRNDDRLVRFWAAMNYAIVKNGVVGNIELVRAIGIPKDDLPSPGPIIFEDVEARLARNVVLHGIVERGETLMVRTMGKRLLRRLDGEGSDDLRLWLWTGIYIVFAMALWILIFRRHLRRRQVTLMAWFVLTILLSVTTAVPYAVDVLMPVSDCNPAWADISISDLWERGNNFNLPRRGLSDDGKPVATGFTVP